MTEAALAMSAELASTLAANEQADPRTKPVRFSHLKQMGRSPAHALHAMQHDMEPTLALRIGKGTHSLLLGGPPVVCNPFKQRRGKDYDKWLETQPGDAIILSKKEYDRAHRMNESVRRDALACQVLFAPGTIYETTILWEQMGRKRRCTPDARSKSHLVELKSCRDASPEKFRWDAIRMGYPAQLGDYAAAMTAENGYPPKSVYIVAVESAAPYLCSVHRLTPAAIDRGASQARAWLEQMIQCEQSGKWPGYSDSILEFDVPLEAVDLVWNEDDQEGEDES